MTQSTFTIEAVNPVNFFGVNNANLELIKKAFPKLKINSRGNKILISGSEEEIHVLEDKLETMVQLFEKYGRLTEKNVENLLEGIDPFDLDIPEKQEDVLVYGPNGIVVKARTPNQKKMVQLSEKNDVMFAIGPAGTGKTYTAVALAVRALKHKQVKKIILTRPAVEAGESLGFLPGDLKEKIDPYLRPLYDALDDMLPFDKLNYYMANRTIEVAPLAFMRGRTLDNAFVILDEAQNTTDLQLKMFLTRLGPSAKCIITGDLTQVDLPKNQRSGLHKALAILSDIKGIATVRLTNIDVIRHKLVKFIVEAYDASDEAEEQQKEERDK